MDCCEYPYNPLNLEVAQLPSNEYRVQTDTKKLFNIPEGCPGIRDIRLGSLAGIETVPVEFEPARNW